MLISYFPIDKKGYKCFIKETDDPKRCRKIDGSVTSRHKCVGYCAYEEHPGYLTQSLLRKHQCIEKECHNYYVFEKKTRDKTTKSKNTFESEEIEVLKKANSVIKSCEGMKFIKAKLINVDMWQLSFVAIARYDLNEVKSKIQLKLSIDVELHNMNLSYERSAALIFS